jgi:hypothetical protein
MTAFCWTAARRKKAEVAAKHRLPSRLF